LAEEHQEIMRQHEEEKKNENENHGKVSAANHTPPWACSENKSNHHSDDYEDTDDETNNENASSQMGSLGHTRYCNKTITHQLHHSQMMKPLKKILRPIYLMVSQAQLATCN